MEGSGELLLTILSSQAQEESRNISENCHWGIVRRFEEGRVRVNHTMFLGYTKDQSGNLVIVPEEAELVRRIFRLFLEGNSSYKIKRILEQEGIRTVTGKAVWQASVIDKMLSNEKYMGDALLQKTYTVDFLSKKRVKNCGMVAQYYIEDDHEPIISKELFHRVQEEKARRASMYKPASRKRDTPQKSKYSSKYVLSDILVCAECGQPYRRQVWSKYGQKHAVWRCDNRLKHGSRRCKHSPTLKEKTLHGAIMTAVNRVADCDVEFVQAFRENVMQVIGSHARSVQPDEYDARIEELQKKLLSCIEESAKRQVEAAEFEKEYRMLTEQLKELKQKKEKSRKEHQLADSYEQRVTDMEQYIKKMRVLQQEFDDELIRRLLKMVRVVNQNKIEIHFLSGIFMTQSLNGEE